MSGANKHKRFATWLDETLWSKQKLESGLFCGVYDHHKQGKASRQVQGGRITSIKDARAKAKQLNDELKDAYVW